MAMKDSHIKAKERWAEKWRANPRQPIRSADRLPPGQKLVHSFPVLDLGVHPDIPLRKWELKIHGHVENPLTLDWQQFMALPQVKRHQRLSLCHHLEPIRHGMGRCRLPNYCGTCETETLCTHVFFKSYDGYTTNNPLAACLDSDVLIAHNWHGKPLSKEHGGPARVIIPKRYAWKGAKFIREIPFFDRDMPGFLGITRLFKHG